VFIRTARNQPDKPISVDQAWARTLRSKLLTYRFHHHERRSRDVVAEILNRYGRVGEIFLALLEVAPTEEIRDKLVEFELGVFQEQVEDDALSLEAEVLRAILDCRNLAVGGRLQIKNVVDALNVDRTERNKLDPRRVGRITNRLCFKKARMPDSKGSKAPQLDEELLSRFQQTYDIKQDILYPPETSKGQNVRASDQSDHLTKKGDDANTLDPILEPAPITPDKSTEGQKDHA